MKDVDYLRRIRAARAALQNPYAYISELEEPAESPLRRSGNPYASLSMMDDDEASKLVERSRVSSLITPLSKEGGSIPFLSKEAFRRDATRIFEGYIPRHQRRRIRRHHRTFIERNESRSGHVRWRLIAELKRYDLSDLKAVRPHFNRELPDELSDKKLLQLEAKVVAEFPES